MIVVEVGIQRFVTRNAYIAPATFEYTINIKRLALFWTQVLSVTDESTDERIFVLSVIGNYTEHFAKVASVAECKNTQESWIFNMDTQKLTINYGLDFNPLYTPMEYLRVFGMCDKSVVYVDDIAYLPVISSAPKISQMQDLIGYDKMAFNSGGFGFNNEAGLMDFMRSMSLFNNDVALYWLEYDGRSEYTRAELVPLAWYLLENLEIGKRSGKVTLQDIRKSWSKKIPSHLFNATEYPTIDDDIIDKPIPLLFGSKNCTAYCTNGTTTTGNVNYRVCESFTAILSVAKTVDGKPVYLTPVSISYTTGEFVLSAADARDEDGVPLEIYGSFRGIVDSGETYATPLEIIKYIEEEYNNASFTVSFFDTTEIVAEIGALEGVELLIDSQVEIYEFIRQMQEGSSNRFRYEINASNLRTARLDNLSRTSSAFITKEEILENESMIIYTDKDTIAATVKINYNKDGITGNYRTVIDTSKETAVAQSAREKPEIEFDTFLETRVAATARALLEATRLGQIRRFTDCTLRGVIYMSLRIYDIITVELLDEAREWAGTWKCQVLSIAPDTDNEQNKVKLLLVERIADIDENRTLLINHEGNIIVTNDTDEIKVVTK
jgi:hypothetical protein